VRACLRPLNGRRRASNWPDRLGASSGLRRAAPRHPQPAPHHVTRSRRRGLPQSVNQAQFSEARAMEHVKAIVAMGFHRAVGSDANERQAPEYM